MNDMAPEAFIAALEAYKQDLEGILSRFSSDYHSIHINPDDDPPYRQKVLEIRDLLNDAFGASDYSRQVIDFFGEGISNFTGSPSYKSVENIIGVIGAVLTRVRRRPELVGTHESAPVRSRNVFVIHGRDEAKWRELKDILTSRFGLNPIILQEQPDIGAPTLIEKFEHYAKQCSYAIAVFTPDDQVTSSGETYVQARPNVIYELGWFCGKLGRNRVMLLLKEGTSVFSDFGGIVQKRFRANVVEKAEEIRRDLVAAGILTPK